VKPETLKSILSLVRNADGRTSAVSSSSSSSSIKDVGGADGVTSHIRDTASDDATCDVTGEGSSPAGDAAVDEPRWSATETCDALQDEQMRLATEGQCLTVLRYIYFFSRRHT